MQVRNPLTARKLVVILALASLIGAAVVAYQSILLPRPVHDAITRFFDQYEEAAILLGLLGLLVLYGLGTPWARRRREHEHVLEGLKREQASRDANVTGERLTREIEAWIEGKERTSESDQVQERLREVLVSTYGRELGSGEAAVEYLDEGNWTTDRIEAAYLSEEDAVEYPLIHRLYAWLYPGRAYGRQVTHALAAVEDVCDDRFVSYERPTDRWQWGQSLLGRVRSLLASRRGSE